MPEEIGMGTRGSMGVVSGDYRRSSERSAYVCGAKWECAYGWREFASLCFLCAHVEGSEVSRNLTSIDVIVLCACVLGNMCVSE